MNKEFIQLIHGLIESKDWKNLKSELNRFEPHQIAELMEEVTESDAIIIFRLLSRELAKDVFAYLPHEQQEDIFEQLASQTHKLAGLLNDLEPDDRTAFFEELPGKVTQRLLQMLSAEERATAVRLLGYPEESVGRLMTPDYVAVRPYFTVTQALNHIRQFARNFETINMIYVVDNNWKLLDALTIKDLILASPESTIQELTDGRFAALNVLDDQEVAVRMFRDVDQIALPVVDSSGTLVGMVTVDDIIDVAEEENTEDFQRFGSVQDLVINPVKARVGLLYKQRILWLVGLVFMNVFSGAVMASFEDVIQQVVALVFFLPLLIDSGGNAGSQSATLMIRSIAVGDVQARDWMRLLSKELVVSLLLGVTMAVAVSLVASFRAPDVTAVVALTMVMVVMAGSMIGMLLPFIFTKLKLDPATACAPLITSISDITGVFIYFSVATWYFHF